MLYLPSCPPSDKKGGLRFVNQVRTMPVFNEDDDIAAFMSMMHEI